MSDHEEILHQRVRELMPEIEIQNFEINQEGLINDVAIVNHKMVFRIAKTKEYAQTLANELKILEIIRPRIGLAIPTPVFQSEDCVVYPFLDGVAFSREELMKLENKIQIAAFEQIGSFLNELHSTPLYESDWAIPTTLAPVTRDRWLDIRNRVIDKVYPYLMNHQIRWANHLFDFFLSSPEAFAHPPSLIHGDLAPYHILFDRDKKSISGILDFGVAGIGDPASDIGSLIYAYGERLAANMHTTYRNLEKYLPRARFYAQAIELQWILLGIETGEKFWFTAHIGGVRDVKI